MNKEPNSDCELCGARFFARPWDRKRGRGKYCSASCRSKIGRASQDTTGDRNPNWKGGVWKSNTLKKAAEWNAANPDKRRAHHAVQNEIEQRRMLRMPCQICGAERTDAHHADYSKHLEVRWLCRSCHLREHRSL
jgi:hypothetical protein